MTLSTETSHCGRAGPRDPERMFQEWDLKPDFIPYRMSSAESLSMEGVKEFKKNLPDSLSIR